MCARVVKSSGAAYLASAVATSLVISTGLDLSASVPTAASHLGMTVSARYVKTPLARQSVSAAELIVSSWTAIAADETDFEISYEPSEATRDEAWLARQRA